MIPSSRWWMVGSVLPGLMVPAGVMRAQGTVTVYAAASLAEAFTELGRRFEATRPGVRVRLNFGGSQQLALQLQQGARADLFASADQRWMNAVRDSGLVLGDPEAFAENRLVVIVPRANPASIRSLGDLARAGVKLVVAAEAVPVGRYTREALGRLSSLPGFGADYAARVLANVVSYEDNVKGVVAKVQLGEADAGVVYRSDAAGAASGRVSTLAIPDSANVRGIYPIAVLKRTSNPALARAFVHLVFSAEGQGTLARWGLRATRRGAGPSRP